MITGSVGAGKTTAARQLAERLGIPCFSGDAVAHGYAAEDILSDNGRFRRTDEEQAEIIDGILGYDGWVVYGGFLPSQEALYAAADHIVLLEARAGVRKRRILLRWFRQRLRLESSERPPSLSILRRQLAQSREHDAEGLYRDLCARYPDKTVTASSCGDILKYLQEQRGAPSNTKGN